MAKEKKEKAKGLPMETPGFFGFFDILGFGNTMMSKGAGWCALKYGMALEPAIRNAHAAGASKTKTIKPDLLNFAWGSDSLFVWTKDQSPDALEAIVISCNHLLVNTANIGWPVRGAITCGELVIDAESNVFLGKPIVKAVAWESRQDWIGAIFDDTCLPEICEPTKDSLIRHKYLVNYGIPVKQKSFGAWGRTKLLSSSRRMSKPWQGCIIRKLTPKKRGLALGWPTIVGPANNGKLLHVLAESIPKGRSQLLDRYNNTITFWNSLREKKIGVPQEDSAGARPHEAGCIKVLKIVREIG